jgi:hypothetical protein
MAKDKKKTRKRITFLFFSFHSLFGPNMGARLSIPHTHRHKRGSSSKRSSNNSSSTTNNNSSSSNHHHPLDQLMEGSHSHHTVASSCLSHGRSYHNTSSSYWLPNDNDENDRLTAVSIPQKRHLSSSRMRRLKKAFLLNWISTLSLPLF